MSRHALAALVLLTAPAAAQEVSGVLVDPAGRPVRAAVVSLVDSAGARHAAGLTDERGEFRLRGPEAGRFAVRAERVGFQPTKSGMLDLSAGGARQLRLTASADAITLEGITVRSTRRCRALAGSADALIWEEARKALVATEQAAQSDRGRYQVVRYRRELDPTSLAVWREERREDVSTSARAFRSVPADSLLGLGFVTTARDSVTWFAPDAGILLSDPFLATHCFAAVTHPDSAALVGLRFQPVPGRSLPEVAGTLWLHRGTAALRFLEYGYLNAGAAARRRQVGGRVEFQQLPSGVWIVRRWWIRLPVVGNDEPAVLLRSGRFPTVSRTPVIPGGVVRSLIEVGGEVQASGAQNAASPPGRIRGTVWDSIAGGPLVGARVFVSGTVHSTQSGPGGSFELSDLPDGVHTVSFTHPILETAGIPAPPLQVTVAGGSAAGASLVGPTAAAVLAARCPAQAPGRGALVGMVADGAGAQVIVGWMRLEAGMRSVRRVTQEAVVGADGRFALCGLELEKALDLTVKRGEQEHHQTITLDRRVTLLRVEPVPR